MKLTSRFIREDDEKYLHWGPLDFSRPLWWSRRYEYCWALQFVKEDDIVLDAACGVGHPFKFMLQEIAPRTSAGDKNTKLLLRDHVLKQLWDGHGREAYEWAKERIDRLDIGIVDITSMDRIPEGVFTKVFCISSLEHLKEEEQQMAALKELSRVLHPEGMLVMTFDFPTVSLDWLEECMEAADLVFAGKVDKELPSDAITDGSLVVFRAAMRKRP